MKNTDLVIYHNRLCSMWIFPDRAPQGWTRCFPFCVATGRGTFGQLVINNRTGIYRIHDGSGFHSCDQRQADAAARKDALPEAQAVIAAFARTSKDAAEAAGLSAAEMAERFDIPPRTMQQWISGDRTPPKYVLSMIQHELGLLP